MVKVVLTQDVTSLGKAGELKDVSPGYMRNFLVPKKMAVMATASELQTLEARRTAIVRAQQKVRTDAETLAARLAEAQITFQVRVGEQKRLYGSITSKDIADELARAYADHPRSPGYRSGGAVEEHRHVQRPGQAGS